MSRDILDVIDSAIGHWEVSDDAMRMNAPVSLAEEQLRGPRGFTARSVTFRLTVDVAPLMESLKQAARQIGDAYARLPDVMRQAGIIMTDFSRATEPRSADERWQQLLAAKRGRSAPPGVELVTQSRRR